MSTSIESNNEAWQINTVFNARSMPDDVSGKLEF